MRLCERRDLGSWNEYHAANVAQACRQLIRRLGEAPEEATEEYHKWDDLLFHDGYLMLVYWTVRGLRWCVGPLCDVLFTNGHKTVLHVHVAAIVYHPSLRTGTTDACDIQEIDTGNVVWSFPMPGDISELVAGDGDKFQALSEWMEAKTSRLASSARSPIETALDTTPGHPAGIAPSQQAHWCDHLSIAPTTNVVSAGKETGTRGSRLSEAVGWSPDQPTVIRVVRGP